MPAINILVADDSEIVRAVIIKTLAMAKVDAKDVFQASNGQEALEALEAHHVDLILTDINMPVMNGIDMIRKIKRMEEAKSIPLVVITTEASKNRIAQLEEMGVDGVIRKPFTPEELSAVVEKIMGSRHGS